MDTPAWIPLATAGAALVGGGVGAALQGTFSVNSWRRQTRYEAYSAFLAATHLYHNSLVDYLQAHALDAAPETIDEAWGRTRKGRLMIQETAGLVIVAGPAHLGNDAAEIVQLTKAIAGAIRGDSELAAAAASVLRLLPFDELKEFQHAMSVFMVAARRVLKTDHFQGRLPHELGKRLNRWR